MFNYEKLLYHGDEIEKDHVKTAHYFKMASDKGYPLVV